MKRQKEHRSMVEALAKGRRSRHLRGVLGRVTSWATPTSLSK
jgi:preprotein translocase subunit YajC